MDLLLGDLKLLLGINDITNDKLLSKCISSSIRSIKRYINNPKYNDEIIVSEYDDVVLEIAKRGYYSLKFEYGIKSKSQGQRSITYSDNLDVSPYTITTDLKTLLPGPFINVL